MSAMTPELLRQAGLEALRRELGAAGMVRFLQQFELGAGNYTVDRWKWLQTDADVESLAKAIQQELIRSENGDRATSK
jgi:hypothetical protein